MSTGVQDAVFIGIIFISLLFLLKPLVIDRLSPQGVDVVGGIGKTHQINEYNKESGERALWNPNIFAGMPVYHRISAQAFSVDTLLKHLSRILHIVFLYYFFGAIGFYLLLRYLKMVPLIAFFGALLFIFMPHYKSLYLVGHLAKFKALMLLPWIYLTFRYFLDKRSLLSAALFALAFGAQIRTQHYQIVFYAGLLIFAAGIYPFLKDLFAREYVKFTKSTALLLAAVALAVLMSAQPLFLAKEYLPWSKRGKTTIDVNKPVKAGEESDGVSWKYATDWSTAPSEVFTWLVPRFYGGMSGEKYNSSEYKHLKGQQIPGYWGYMPFTQSYEYMGLVTLLLAVLGIIFYRKNSNILSLLIFAVFLILLSFGKHFAVFYGIFYNVIPFFNKFRAPMMSVTVTYFIITLMAAYGLHSLSQMKFEPRNWKDYKHLIYPLGGMFVLGILFLLIGLGSSFNKPSGEPYQGQSLEIIRNIRSEFFFADVGRYFLILVLAAGTLAAYFFRKINFLVFAAILGIIAVGDLLNIQQRLPADFKNNKRLEQRYFSKSSTDLFLEKDTDTFRIFPAGKMFGDNRWAYYHQTIGGYTPIKMYTIEELVEKNIYNGWDKQLPINWNVLKILNVKYVVLEQPVNSDFLTLVHNDKSLKRYTYLFKEALPRAFFADRYIVQQDEYERLGRINSKEFNPAEEAVLEEELLQKTSAPDSSFNRMTSFSPNKLEFDVYTDKQSLLVLSELYYPPGWKILIDDQQADKIYRTNHAVQSVVVPAGRHKIELRFEPDSYFNNKRLSAVSVIILYAVIAWAGISFFLQRKKKAGQS